MAQTTLISSISRSTTYPVSVQATADNCCGTLSLIIPNAWSKQMLMELPTINISIFMEDGTKLKSFNINMTTVNNEIKNAQSTDAYSIPIYDIPESFTFSIIPLFDKFALSAHNHNVENGNIEIFNTSSDGIVDTDIEDYSSEIWTTDTQTFNVKIVFDDSNISASGGSGGGGGGGSITVDTQVLPNSINPVQNRAIYDFVNSSVSTNTAYFIGTFNSVADLEAYSGSVSNNDYAFVIGTDSDSNTIYNRYKYNGSTETWEFEYALNNSSFTAAEWETIQSGLTAQDKTNYNNHLSNTDNPHFVTKSQIGLGNVGNFKAVSTVASQGLSDTEKSNARANINAQENLAFDGTYNSSTNKVATQSTVSDSINALDVSSVGGAGKVISAISETNGKISATVTTMDTTPITNSTNPVTSGGVAESQAAQETEIGVVANAGAKNFAVPVDPISTTDIIVTRNANGSYTFVCTNVSENRIIRVANIGDMPSGAFKISGITGGSSTTYMLGLYNTSATAVKYQHTNPEESYTGDVSGFSLRVRVISGYSGTFTVYPMIRPASITDSTFVQYAKTNVELTNENTSQQSEINHAVNTGVKNYCPYNNLTAASAETIIDKQPINLPAGTYILSCSVTASTNSIAVRLLKDGTSLWNKTISNTGGSIVEEIIITDTANQITFYTGVANTLSNIMIRSAAITDPIFQPYALPNSTITPAAIKAVDEGAKNLLPITIQTQTVKMVVFTVNSDGTITANGTVTGGDAYLNLETSIGDKYTGKILSGGASDLKICISKGGSGQIAVRSESSDGVEIPDNATNTIFLYAVNGTQLNNVTVKPMICTASDWAVSQKFVPYCPTMQEMYQMILALQSGTS